MLTSSQEKFAELLSQLINCNPFLPERIEIERQLLGSSFVAKSANWNLHPSEHQRTENLNKIYIEAVNILSSVKVSSVDAAKLPLVQDLLWFVLFSEFSADFEELDASNGENATAVYDRFRERWLGFCPASDVPKRFTEQIPHIFALLFQIRRAFDNTFRHIIGSSAPVIELRANVWRSIFTHDLRRFSETMFSSMMDFPTLITGPTGSGKELVARAIGLSGFVPYNERKGEFEAPLDKLFVSLNLSALSPTLIESELFGHRKGAFTGATNDRVGWLEACPQMGAVFLDEIGELDHDIQVKLLRVAQDRVFQRLGDTQPKTFHGRIISATNRDLATEISAGRFRKDFYYRLCADQIRTPSLAERCKTDKGELDHLAFHLLTRIIGHEDQALCNEWLTWARKGLGAEYAWPGNVRELDQCIRSWLIRQDYKPCLFSDSDGAEHSLEGALATAELTADELLTRYCKAKYQQTGSYVKTAELLGLDRRTVKSRVDPA